MKEKMNIEQVWIDFGKQHTKSHAFDPTDTVANPDGELNFNGH